MSEPRVFGVLVTYRRPSALSTMLTRLADQDRRLDALVVVDNAPRCESEEVVRTQDAPMTEYVAAPENLGPAGGFALGMERVLRSADDVDWIVCLDDDDPPSSSSVIAELLSFGQEMRTRDRTTGAVGIMGARFDQKRGRMMRVPDVELIGPVRVDALAGNALPFYLVRAVRDAGVFSAELFFGFEELDQGLRLRDAGYAIFADGDRWRRHRGRAHRLGLDAQPSTTLAAVSWRRYYSLRNIIHILRSRGRTAGAMRVTAVHGFGKPLANLPLAPRAAIEHLRVNAAACRDAWIGRMGRTVEPQTGEWREPHGLDERTRFVSASDPGADP